MFNREIEKKIDEYKKFRIIAIVGPRQSGKSTLAQKSFPNHKFISLDLDVNKNFAQEDPEGFLNTYANQHGIILDEAQKIPEFFPYLKYYADKHKKAGYFILTGSQNFLLNKEITESLAGRVGIINLLPLSLKECSENNIISENYTQAIYKGFYPELYDTEILPSIYYQNYIQTYIERDVRSLINIVNLSVFKKFLSLCAGRVGQLLNLESLAIETGVSAPTIKHWLSILESSYIIFLLQPYYKNFNKRLTKSTKLYFFDTGIATSLLNIKNAEDLLFSPFKGHLFENLIIADLYKQYTNLALQPNLYFWRDLGGTYEIDCITEVNNNIYPIEIKAGETIINDFFKGIEYFKNISNCERPYIIYGGKEKQIRTNFSVLGWQESAELIESLK
jgi:predicted AAA+ superfamily ATPase